MVSQNKFTEFFGQWGHIGTTVAWGNNRERVRLCEFLYENNEINIIIFIESTGLEACVSIDELYPLFCQMCQRHSFIGLIRCEGCHHKQCPKCMEIYENKCGKVANVID